MELRPRSGLPQEGQSCRLHNLNVRGKRGNIVQTYPSVEYDFIPNRLNIESGDCIHVQWTGETSLSLSLSSLPFLCLQVPTLTTMVTLVVMVRQEMQVRAEEALTATTLFKSWIPTLTTLSLGRTQPSSEMLKSSGPRLPVTPTILASVLKTLPQLLPALATTGAWRQQLAAQSQLRRK